MLAIEPSHDDPRGRSVITGLLRLAWGSYRASIPRTARALIRRKPIIIAPRHRVLGLKNIRIDSGRLGLGIRPFGFTDSRVAGLLRVRGQLRFQGFASIGKGCRWDVGPDAVVTVGEGTYFSPDTLLVSSRAITIGARCAISWGTQLLDDDYHTLRSDGPVRPKSLPIVIGNHVWIGNKSMILKGARIPDGCVVAANSVVTGQFNEPNCILAGIPARVISRDVEWDVPGDAPLGEDARLVR